MAKKKEMIDPEEMMRRKFKAKCQFRALGRLVMANAHWLIEGVDDYEGLDDVRRRVEQAVRGKAKKKRKQLLNVKDKALLNKPADDRTDKEKQYIYRIIGGLKCFKRYPNHVKKKLAAVTYFKYYGPGRTIVRQHHDASAMYFIVSGSVVVSQLIFDDLLNEWVDLEIGEMQQGDLFGEVSLLHNIPRTATVITAEHCELLALMKEDFKNVLQASVQKQWDEILKAMSAFSYFDALDEVARREGCIVAKMKSYERDETLLGDGVGISNFVYFVLSGRCQMIESLQIGVKRRLGVDYFSLYDPFIPIVESEQDFDTKYFGKYLERWKMERSSYELDEDKTESRQDSKVERTSDDVAHEESNQNEEEYDKKPRVSRVVIATDSKQNVMTEQVTVEKSTVEITGGQREKKSSLKLGRISTHRRSVTLSEPNLIEDKRSNLGILRSSVVLVDTNRKASSISYRMSLLEVDAEEDLTPKPPQNMRTYFMQVCQFNPGSSFGFGENMRDRRIIALTRVDCMLMPKVWLLQKNTANIWTRIQYYLEKKIPNKKQLFKEFVSARRWLEYRNMLVEDVVARSNTSNWTSVHDVPYSIRMEEMPDV